MKRQLWQWESKHTAAWIYNTKMPYLCGCSASYGDAAHSIYVPIEWVQGENIAALPVKFKPCLTKQ